MIKKLLIANRGEIACRIIRSAHHLGIKTVAVYSDADARALHVKEADEAVHIGPAPARDSYLRIDKIIDACKETGADAVHPGFGFLSERVDFVEALEKEGIIFVGPPAEAVRIMGDKIISKQTAEKAGVSVVPGFNGEIADADKAVQIADEIGYPVMIKASAGGGGKGMRIARNADETREGYDLARSEAAASFGDDRVFIERYIENPRHIEIQILGDKQGNLVNLFERECSIQRRHQKVIEEAPSPFVTPEMRKKMGAEAVALARAVGYHSAGTVEFVVSQTGKFFFLEMNTRIQVEHPVTELITGVDLIEQMLKVADGQSLPFKQEDLKIDGHALECRIYAEDPYRNFMPSVGRLKRYNPPQAGQTESGATVRIDTGVYEGAEISPFYDPMIAKLCTHGTTRDIALDTMLKALDGFEIDGVNPNLDFLAALCEHPDFKTGNMSTNFIAQHYPEGFQGVKAARDSRRLAVAAVAYHDYLRRKRAADNRDFYTDCIPFFADIGPTGKRDKRLSVACDLKGETGMNIALSCPNEGKTDTDYFEMRDGALTANSTVFNARVNGETISAKIYPQDDGYVYNRRGVTLRISLRTAFEAEAADYMPAKKNIDNGSILVSPTPGVVKAVFVKAGDPVETGQNLVVVEAMKMENLLKSRRSGIIKAVHCQTGENVAANAPLIQFHEDDISEDAA